MNTLTADLVCDLRADLAESPVWDSRRQRLICVDLLAGKVHAIDPSSGEIQTMAAGGAIGCVAPRVDGQYIAAVAAGMAALDFDAGSLELLQTPDAHDAEQCRFNDGKCDPQGRFWSGTMSWHGKRGLGALYCFADARTSERALAEVSVSNGLAWTRVGRTVYFIDSPTRRVEAFDFDGPTGRLGRRRVAIALSPGVDVPDGCTIDDEDMLWVAHWNGGGVSRWDPRTGRQIAFVRVPAPRVTSCTFGGPDLRTLLITTARRGMTEAELAAYPESGGVFACRPGVSGPAAVAFRG